MCEPNDFYLRVFTFWFDRESIIPGNVGFAISVRRLRERGRMSKSGHVRVFHELDLLRYVLRCAIGQQLYFPAGMNNAYGYRCYLRRAVLFIRIPKSGVSVRYRHVRVVVVSVSGIWITSLTREHCRHAG